MAIFTFLYHSFMARLYNRKAAVSSRQWRHGETPEERSQGSKTTLEKGSASNSHERQRDLARAEIKSWLDDIKRLFR